MFHCVLIVMITPSFYEKDMLLSGVLEINMRSVHVSQKNNGVMESAPHFFLF